MNRQLILALVVTFFLPASVFGGEADVVHVDVTQADNGSFHFDVTVRHNDTGWDHYADKWDVVTPDGTVVGARVLHHPHVDEQPFTRSLSGVRIPTGITTVTVRAHDSVHAYGGETVSVKLPH